MFFAFIVVFISRRVRREAEFGELFFFFIKRKVANKSKKYSASSASPRTLRETYPKDDLSKEKGKIEVILGTLQTFPS